MNKKGIDKNAQDQTKYMNDLEQTIGSEEDEELIGQLLHGFDRMDHLAESISRPSIRQFEWMVKSHKKEIRRKNRVELLLFWLVALIVFGGGTLLALTNLLVFGIFQALVLVGAGGYAFFSYRKNSQKKVDAVHAHGQN